MQEFAVFTTHSLPVAMSVAKRHSLFIMCVVFTGNLLRPLPLEHMLQRRRRADIDAAVVLSRLIAAAAAPRAPMYVVIHESVEEAALVAVAGPAAKDAFRIA